MDTNNCATPSCQPACKIVRNGSSNPVSTGNESNEHLRKIFVGGLSNQTTVESLREFFQKFGEVTDAVVLRDLVTGWSRGFGFVTYVDPKSIEYVQESGPHTIDNKAVETKPAQPRREFTKPGGGGTAASGVGTGGAVKRIFLGGLKECHNNDNIGEYFSQFGKVSTVKLILDNETGRKRGFGFLDFENPASAEKALAQEKHLINMGAVVVKKSTQNPDHGKRQRFPIIESTRDSYMPPLDSYNCNSINFNPYLTQSVLPPSAFSNGWAAYVTPLPGPWHPHHKPVQMLTDANAQDLWSYYPKHGKYPAEEWTPSKLAEYPPKAGHKHAQTSTTDRPRNDYKCAQSTPTIATMDLGARGDADGRSGVGLGISPGSPVGIGAIKKWPTADFKIFKPAANSTQCLNTKMSSDRSSPAYGV
ncbi:RNA-binding protein 1 [Drosophila eugracilis]|uniref:RNA-binding protein 1 n=1 Tax=Drosophila eugracilis TaxID=29029 RepID=UPI001BD9F9C4|nr:RNA-binding protein 1 [Drosophila eugracilis]